MKTLRIIGGVVAVGFVLSALVIGIAAFTDYRGKQAQQRWEWDHYTGYRLFVADDEEDKAHGMLRDKKIHGGEGRGRPFDASSERAGR